jgi:effector-binding domain-containing protein
MVKYYGPYSGIKNAYNSLQTYITDRNLEESGSAWEEYLSDPVTEPDTNKWQTNVYIPLK